MIGQPINLGFRVLEFCEAHGREEQSFIDHRVRRDGSNIDVIAAFVGDREQRGIDREDQRGAVYIFFRGVAARRPGRLRRVGDPALVELVIENHEQGLENAISPAPEDFDDFVVDRARVGGQFAERNHGLEIASAFWSVQQRPYLECGLGEGADQIAGVAVTRSTQHTCPAQAGHHIGGIDVQQREERHGRLAAAFCFDMTAERLDCGPDLGADRLGHRRPRRLAQLGNHVGLIPCRKQCRDEGFNCRGGRRYHETLLSCSGCCWRASFTRSHVNGVNRNTVTRWP